MSLHDQTPLVVDTVFSLGGSCIAALQIKKRHLRTSSLPLDWLFHVSDELFTALASLFECDFDQWMLKENLVPLEGAERGTSQDFQYKDTFSGYRFIHDFKQPIDDNGSWEKVIIKYKRRIERLYHTIEKGSVFFLICNTKWSIDTDKVMRLHKVLKNIWPDKTFLIRVVAFEQEEDSVEDPNEEVRIERYGRLENDYDYYNTNFEWMFLDSVKLRNEDRIFQRNGKSLRIKLSIKSYGIDLRLGRIS